jgi:thiol-disulfide isomerase/thioredoxin
MRLSEYRGKVVVLDFWADWCPHCVNMYPLERKLVKQYANQPFALLGINCDEPARFRRVLAQKTVTWLNWHDGPAGPIGQTWRIESFPTLYVLDHEGKIRYINVRGEDLEKAIKDLIAKAPGGNLELAQAADEAESAKRVAEAPVLPSSLPDSEPELRVWTSRDGRTAKFRFLGLEGDRVRLRRESGKELTAPLSVFSDADQAWARGQSSGNPSPGVEREDPAKPSESESASPDRS